MEPWISDDLGRRIKGLGCSIQDFGLRVQGLRFEGMCG